MTLEYLREFLILADEKNYSEAAELLYLNQSTLSKHIKALERELDAPLFERSTRNVKLTVYGEQLIPYAKKICRLGYDYYHELEEKKNNVLNIGAIPTMSLYGLMDIILKFKRENPEVKLKINEADSVELGRDLLNRKYELVFMRNFMPLYAETQIYEDQIRSVVYNSYNMAAIIPKGHELSNLSEITLHQLEGHRLCLLKERTMQYEICMSAFRSAGIVPNIFYTSHWVNSILDVCSFSGCIGLLLEPPKHVVDRDMFNIKERFAVVPIVPALSSTLMLCSLRDKNLSDQAAKFLKFFQSEIADN